MALRSQTWMRACQSTDWLWSWGAQAGALCTGSLDREPVGSAPHIGRTKDLLCPCMDPPRRQGR